MRVVSVTDTSIELKVTIEGSILELESRNCLDRAIMEANMKGYSFNGKTDQRSIDKKGTIRGSRTFVFKK